MVYVVLTSVALLGVSACNTRFDEPVTKKDAPVTKDYDYLFKVIVPEEVMRSMTDDQHEQMVAKIEKMGAILDQSVDKTKRNVEEDVTMTPAFVNAAVFVSEELRNTAYELTTDGATISFSYEELLTDNSSPEEIKDGTQDGERSVGTPGRVFVFDGQSNPRDNAAWKIEEAISVPSRGVGDESSNTDVNAVATTNVRAAKNPEVMESFFENLVDQVASNPAVSMEVKDSSQPDGASRGVEEQERATVSLKTGGSEMSVELEGVTATDLMTVQRSMQNGNERSWFSKATGITNASVKSVAVAIAAPVVEVARIAVATVDTVVTVVKDVNNAYNRYVPRWARRIYWAYSCVGNVSAGTVFGAHVGATAATVYCGATFPRRSLIG